MARTAPVPNIPPIPGMCPSIAVAGGGGDSGGSGGQGAGKGGGGGPGTGGGAADGTGGDGKAAPDPKKYPLCGTKSHPVDVVTGRAFTHQLLDFESGGPLPFRFERSASSTLYARDFGMGPTWAHSLGWQIEVRRDAIWVFSDKGTKVAFPLVQVGDEVLGPFGWRLRLDHLGYEVDADDGLYRRFGPEKNFRALLVEIRDRNDNKISLSYDAKAALQLVADSGGREIRVRCDDRNHITAFLVQRSPGEWFALAEYFYDDGGRLVRATDTDGLAHRYAYNDRSQLTFDQDRSGLCFHFRFDSSGRCVESWGNYGEKPDPSLAEALPEFLSDGVTRCKGIHHCVFEWAADGLCVVIDSTQSSNCFGNEYGLLDKMVEGGVVTSATYREDGHLSSVTDGMGAQTIYRRDVRGRVTAAIDALGRTAEFERDGFGLLIKITDPSNSETTFSRDLRGNLIWARDAEGGLTQYQHDHRGLVTKITDAGGGHSHYEWDAAGNLVSATAPNGAMTRYTCDFLGRRTSETDPLGHSVRYNLSGRGDLLSAVDALGNVTSYSYDGERQLTCVTTAERHVTSYVWGGYHKLCYRTDANQNEVRLGYNVEGELTHVWNEKGELHRLHYSPGGSLLEEQTFDGRSLAYQYDKAGRPTTIRNGARELSEYVYDVVGQLLARTLHDGSEERYEYSKSSELVLVRSPGVEIRLDRDRCGRVVGDTQTVGGDTQSIHVKYDMDGARVERITSLGHNERITRDKTGIRQTTDLDGHIVKRISDLLGRETARELAGGGTIESTFDPAGRLSERNVFGLARSTINTVGKPDWVGTQRSGATVHKAFHYSRDGELVSAIDETRGKTEFRYDPIGQLLAMLPERARAEVFNYDATGNVFEAGPDAQTRVYTRGSRLVRNGETELEWDADGRLIEKRVITAAPGSGSNWKYQWNAAGLMRSAKRDDGLEVTFTYDAFARRLEKSVYRRKNPAEPPSLESKTRFVWDGHVLVHEIRTEVAANEMDRRVLERTYWFEDALFEPYAHKERITVGGEVQELRWLHYVNEPGGTPDRLVDERGEVAGGLHASAWGRTGETAGAPAQTPLRLQGQYWDEETELAYNRWRYYDGEGRFCSADPMRIAGGLNLYAFPPNAVGWADPFGLVKKSAIPAANWDRIQKLPEGPGIYVLEGNGVKYVGSGVDMKARICDSDHAKAENILKDPNCKISYHEVKRNPNDPGHSLKVAEQTIMKKENIVPVPGSKTQNSIPALGEDKFDLYSNDPNCTPVVMRKKAIK